ncbi:MAG: peptidoglycan DD-metalloendopeptidase family protein [Burkholderiales bacterium]|nr:peptidoglycan DD-metalloendopeptidase family protein [Burkholderiales bacterium]
MANQSAGVLAIDTASFVFASFVRQRRSVAALLLAVVAGCANQPPAPIVHRAPPVRGQAATPPAGAPGAGAPIVSSPGTGPSGVSVTPVGPGTAAPGAATAGAAPAQPDGAPAVSEAAPVVETAPVRPSSVESRPLPSTPAPAPAAAPAVTPGSTITAPAAPSSSNLLKTTPKALKQPYSDALFAQLKGAGAAPAAGAAVATPGSAAASGSPPAGSPAAGGAGTPATAAPASAPPSAVVPPSGAAPAAGGSFIWPASGRVLQPFSEPGSMGMAIDGKPGDPVVAAGDGRVIFSGPGPRGYGNLLIVKHDANTLSVYAHNRALLVKEGQNVKRGQRIAELGSSGTDRPKLHFEIRKQGKPVDPQKFLPAR